MAGMIVVGFVVWLVLAGLAVLFIRGASGNPIRRR